MALCKLQVSSHTSVAWPVLTSILLIAPLEIATCLLLTSAKTNEVNDTAEIRTALSLLSVNRSTSELIVGVGDAMLIAQARVPLNSSCNVDAGVQP